MSIIAHELPEIEEPPSREWLSSFLNFVLAPLRPAATILFLMALLTGIA